MAKKILLTFAAIMLVGFAFAQYPPVFKGSNYGNNPLAQGCQKNNLRWRDATASCHPFKSAVPTAQINESRNEILQQETNVCRMPAQPAQIVDTAL